MLVNTAFILKGFDIMNKISKNLLQDVVCYARLSKKAYDENILSDGEKVVKFSDDDSGTDVFLMEIGEKEVVIAVRGTQPSQIADVKTDLDFAMTRLDEGKVHCGFLKSAELIYEYIVTHFSDYPVGDKKVVVCGHSLGGAVAVLLGYQLKTRLNLSNMFIYTFGQPRVGNKTFVNQLMGLFPETYWRVVDDRDIVPELPPSIGLFYRHSPTLIYIDHNGNISKRSILQNICINLQVRAEMFFKFALVRRSVVEYSVSKIIESVMDHDMRKYLKALESALKHWSQK